MQAADAQAPAAAPEIMRLNPELLAKGGLVVAEQGDGAAGFGASVAEHFLPINMTFPGLRALNVDPPVFGISGFLAPDECDALVTAAKTSGKMAKSSTGGGPQREGAAAPVDMRTSTSVPLTQEVFAAQPKLRSSVDAILHKARTLVAVPRDQWDVQADGRFAKPSAPGSFAFELPQVARYTEGQHFLQHEDAFPVEVARKKTYQRRATLLIYLNDVDQGGKTHFDILNIGVAPIKGDALLFFPSFSSGKPDHRTLHTAQAALEGSEKWVSQLWVSWGMPAPAAKAKKGGANKGKSGFGAAKGGQGKKSAGFGAKR